MVIRNNASNRVIYDQTISSLQLQHTIPAYTLQNGKQYNAVVTVFDANDVESPASNTVVFYCFTTPTWEFANVHEHQVIKNSSYLLNLIYAQPEGEALDTWSIHLYNSNKQQIHTSGIIYQTDNLSYQISNLEDNYNYFVRAIGITVNKMELDTGYIAISVEYIQPSMYAILNLENQSKQGNIKIESNIVSIDGQSNPSPPLFIDGEKVDLTKEGSWVKFDEGFSIKNNFTMQIMCNGLKPYSEIFFAEDDNNKLCIRYMKGTFDSKRQAYFLLTVSNGIYNYEITSNYDSIAHEKDVLYIWVRKVNDLYDIKFKNMSASNTYGMLRQFTYGQLRNFTHSQLKNGVITSI